MTALDDLWDYDDPATSEARFRAAIEAAEAGGDPAAADEARTQLARALGLQGRFDDGHAILDRVDADHPADDRVRVRARLERGRLRRSSGDPAASVAPFEAAWELARRLGEDGLAVDAAHMLALVDAPPGERTWHQRALDLADASPDPAARGWRGSLWNNIGWARFGRAISTARWRPSRRRSPHAASRAGPRRRASPSGASAAAFARSAGPPRRSPSRSGWPSRRRRPANRRTATWRRRSASACWPWVACEEARPYFARAAALLGADAWLAEHEPDRIARLRRLGRADRRGRGGDAVAANAAGGSPAQPGHSAPGGGPPTPPTSLVTFASTRRPRPEACCPRCAAARTGG